MSVAKRLWLWMLVVRFLLRMEAFSFCFELHSRRVALFLTFDSIMALSRVGPHAQVDSVSGASASMWF